MDSPLRAGADHWGIDAALLDPDGARRAILSWGLDLDWPACQLGSIKLDWGLYQWEGALESAEALQVGLAWEALCDREDTARAERERPAAIVPAANNRMAKSQKEKAVTVIQASRYEGLEPGYYAARIAELVDEPAKPKTPGMSFEPRPQIRMQFVILDDQGRDTEAQTRGWCNASWGPKAKLYEWAQAILKAKCPPPTEPIDTDLLLNRKCDIQIEQEGDKNPKITHLFPYRSMSVADDDDAPVAVKPVAVKPAAAEEEAF